MTTPRTGDYVFIADGTHHARVGRLVRYDGTDRTNLVPVIALLRAGALPAAEAPVPFKDMIVLARTWERGNARMLPDEPTLLKLYAEGMTYEDMAAMYGLKPFSVCKAFTRLGLSARIRPGHNNTWPTGKGKGDSTRIGVVPALAPRRGDTMNVGCHVLITDGPDAERPGQLVGWDLINGRLAPVVDLLPIRRLKAKRVTVSEFQVRVLLRPWPGAKVAEPTQDTLRRLINAGHTAEEIATRYRMPLHEVGRRIRKLQGVAAPPKNTNRHELPVTVATAHKQAGGRYLHLSALSGAARGTRKIDAQVRAGFRSLVGVSAAGMALTYCPEDGFGTRKARKSDTVKRFRVAGLGQVDVRFAA